MMPSRRPRSVVFLPVAQMPQPSPWRERLRVAAWVTGFLILAGIGGLLDVTDPETVRPRPVAVSR
jgi:hypothetical protein